MFEREKLKSLREHYETGTLFEGLEVEIKRLPDEFTLPSPVLPLGSKVYHLVDSISYGGTVTISEFVVQSNYVSVIRDVPQEILKADMPYRVRYDSYREGETMPLHFELNADGKITMAVFGDCSSPSGRLFFSLEEAQKEEAKIWQSVEKRLNAYRALTA